MLKRQILHKIASTIGVCAMLLSSALLFAWSGTPGTSFGAHIWQGQKAVLNQHIFKVVPNERLVDKEYLKSAINQTLGEQIDKAHGGVGLRHVTKGKFEETKIPVPPLSEQRRIVGKLDTLTGRTARARGELGKIPKLIQKYREAVLDVELRSNLAKFATNIPLARSGRPTHRLAELCDHDRTITYGGIKLGAEHPDGIPCLRTSNVRWLRIEIDGMKRIS